MFDIPSDIKWYAYVNPKGTVYVKLALKPLLLGHNHFRASGYTISVVYFTVGK